MTPLHRNARLASELQRMRAAAKESSILRFTTESEPANQYQIHFHGTSTHPDYLNEHELEIWLGWTYPNDPPEVRFVTPIFHPNVARSGTVALDWCGIVWSPAMHIDRVCERLWDVARYAYIDMSKVANEAAAKWFREQRMIALPVDGRRLCDLREIEWGEVRTSVTGASPRGVQFIDTSVPPPAGSGAAEEHAGDDGIVFLDE